MGRNKPVKPRRERPAGPPQHVHGGCEIPDGFADPGGRPVDHRLLGEVVGAAFDGCTTCQDPLLRFMVEDPATSARTVELACVAVHGQLGGFPPSMTDEDAPGSTSSPEFRRLARAGLDGANGAMFREWERRVAGAERRSTVNTATDTIVGLMAVGG